MRGVLVALVAALALFGCATAQRGTEENVLLNSNPPGAEARVYYMPVADSAEAAPLTAGAALAGAACTTPCALRIGRNTQSAVRFTMPGFEPTTVALGKRISKDGAGLIFTNLSATGAIIDATSGALLDHCPNPVHVNLKAASPRIKAPKPGYIPAIPDDCKVPAVPQIEG